MTCPGVGLWGTGRVTRAEVARVAQASVGSSKCSALDDLPSARRLWHLEATGPRLSVSAVSSL